MEPCRRNPSGRPRETEVNLGKTEIIRTLYEEENGKELIEKQVDEFDKMFPDGGY